MRLLSIEESVGEKGKNLPDDVKVIQRALQEIHKNWGGTSGRLSVDGDCGPRTIQAIRLFQKRNLGKNYATDHMNPKGETVARLRQIAVYKVVDIVGIDANKNSTADMKARGFWHGELAITSVSDLVRQVLHLMGQDPGMRIRTLTIVGHGNPGRQAVGCGTSRDNGDKCFILNKRIELDPNTREPPKLAGRAGRYLQRLGTSGVFAPNAILTLGGCRVAATETLEHSMDVAHQHKKTKRFVDGKDLLKLVSKAFGRQSLGVGERVRATGFTRGNGAHLRSLQHNRLLDCPSRKHVELVRSSGSGNGSVEACSTPLGAEPPE